MRYRTRVRLRYDALVTETDTLLAGLNPVQREAASAPDGPILVIAGAGSGKTRVLTHRVAFLVAEKRVSPFGLLAITFTNKAAGEMKERVADLVGPVAHRMWVSTFHSACARILRRDAPGARLPVVVLDLRPVRRRPSHRLRAARSRPRPEALPGPSAARRDLGPEERARHPGGRLRPCVHAARVPGGRGLPRVPAPVARRLGGRLRRPPRVDRPPVPRAPRRAGSLARPLHAGAGGRVPGHQRRPVGARAHAHRRAPQRAGGGRHRSMPHRGHADHNGRRLAPPDRAGPRR